MFGVDLFAENSRFILSIFLHRSFKIYPSLFRLSTWSESFCLCDVGVMQGICVANVALLSITNRKVHSGYSVHSRVCYSAKIMRYIVNMVEFVLTGS